MAEFNDPTQFVKDVSPRSQSRRFNAEWPTKSWSHKIVGGENVVALIFRANRPITTSEAKQLATQLQNLHSELVQSGSMLATTLPGAEEFPEDRDVFLQATFELKDATRPVELPE